MGAECRVPRSWQNITDRVLGCRIGRHTWLSSLDYVWVRPHSVSRCGSGHLQNGCAR
jgi:hypothetical protein